MINRLGRLGYVFTLGAILLISVSISGTVARMRSQRSQPAQRPVIDKPPAATSVVKKLQVTNVSIENQGEPGAAVVLEFLNESDVAVTAYTISFGDVSVGRDGGVTDNPKAVIEPHGTDTFSIPITNFEEGVPVVVTGVFYADGKEEGTPLVLRRMREDRAANKAKYDKKKSEQNK